MKHYRIRPCNGNKRAWCLIVLRADGSEADAFGSWTTASTLDSLLKYAGRLRPRPGDVVELIPMVAAD